MKNLLVWKWKANVENFFDKPGVIGVFINQMAGDDFCTVGRDGWVGSIERVKERGENDKRDSGNIETAC